MLKPADYRFFDRQRVRWVEIDAQKIVFNGHYLMYFDTAVAAYWRALALPYFETLEALGGDMFVKKATLEYHASARYEDQLATGLRVARVGTSSVLFEGCVFRHAEALVSCQLVYVYADPATQTSRPVPQQLRDVFAAFEAGEPMVQVSLGGWPEHGAASRAIRREVFVGELHAPAAIEADDDDLGALHAVAHNRLGAPLAAGRLVLDGVGGARIGRMAVRQPVRGSAVGRALLDALLEAARTRGAREVRAHVHDDAAGFYRRAGFVAFDAPRADAGIAQLEMVRAV